MTINDGPRPIDGIDPEADATQTSDDIRVLGADDAPDGSVNRPIPTAMSDLDYPAGVP